jgi:hypothetical protein
MFSLLSWDKWLIALAIMVAALVGTYQVGYWRGYNASEQHWKLAKEVEVALAKEEATELRAKGEVLSAELKLAKANIRVETVEVIREVIRYVRSDREAIDGRVTDRLNRLSGIRESTSPVSSTAGTAEADATAAADPDRPSAQVGGTSEKAIVSWAATVIGMYEACRQTHNALVELLTASAGKQLEIQP